MGGIRAMQTDGAHHKLAAIALLVLFAGMVLGTHQLERLFPVVSITLLASMGVILAAYYGREELLIPIGLVCLTTAAYLVWTTQFGASMMRNDPDRIALWSQAILESGTTGSVQDYSSFYASAPLMLLLGAISGLLFDVTAPTAFLIWPVITATVLPTTAAATAWYLWRNQSVALVAAILAATFAHTHMYSIGALPQTLSVYLWVGFVFAGVLLATRGVGRREGLGVLGVFFVASVFTHKISVFVMVITVAVAYGVISVLSTVGVRNASTVGLQRGLALISATGVLLLSVQWEHVTGYTDRAVGRILEIGSSSALEFAEPTAAVPVNADLLSIAAYAAPIIVGLAVGGLCWLALAARGYDDSGVVYVLTACAVVVAMALAGIAAPIANGRIHFFAEPLLAIVIAAGIVYTLGPRKTVVGVAILAFVSVQLFAAPATPDYPNTTQGYLEEPDVDAKLWGENHTDEVYTDQKFERENIPANIERLEYPETYQSFDDGILSGSINESYECVAYRDSADDIHAVEHGTYQMTWDVERAFSEEFNRVYVNDGVRQYCR